MAKDLREEAAELLGGQCEICLKPFSKAFHFHHITYIEGEKTYRDFSNGTNYNLYIMPRIIKDPKRFSLLCHPHHRAVEMMKRWEPAKFLRLAKIVQNSTLKNMR